ncbi:MAG: hypothetical protein FWG13_08140 [Leptospirales bacterium]|nr:hypothetical protein [Leptospirales bacterium]
MDGIVIATMMEAEPFIKGLRLEATATVKPFRIYKGDGRTLAVSGIGKVNAALAAATLILEHKAAPIYNIGAAGALSDALKFGDIRHISAVYEHDRMKFDVEAPYIIKTDVLDTHATASLATGDIPIVPPEDRRALAAFAELVDMEGAAVVRACRRYNVNGYLFKAVSDTAETPEEELIPGLAKVSESLFEYFVGRVINV